MSSEPLTGSFDFPDGSNYTGQYTRDDSGVIKRHGHGHFKGQGFEIQGDFEADHPVNAVLTFSSDIKYEGTFEQGKFSGMGTMTWPTSAKYEGAWANGQPHGEGKFTDAEGREYVGVFVNGTGPGLHAVQ
ncbi:hypothetical protein P9112_005567 [Eukaryota sp. TZLM1-RC]